MKRNCWFPRPVLDPVRESLTSSSGAVLLPQTVRLCGLDRALSSALSPWRAERAVHDPGKMLLDVATAVALGGDCLADVAAVRAQPELFGHGRVGSDDLEVDRHLGRRCRCCAQRDPRCACPGQGCCVGPTPAVGRDPGQPCGWAGGRGHRRHAGGRALGQGVRCADLQAWLRVPPDAGVDDHGDAGTGETLVGQLRTGSASAWASGDHVSVLDQALVQLPEAERGQVLVRADTCGRSKAFLGHITDLGLEYSIGSPANDSVKAAVEAIPAQAGVPRSTVMATPAMAPRSPSSPPGCRPRPHRWTAGLAARDACDRPLRAPPPGRAATVDRRRELADHLLCDQHRDQRPLAVGRP